MATAILSSQNSLNHRFDHRNPNHCASTTVPRRRKRIPTTAAAVTSPAVNTNLVMGQVKILKRGETLSSILKKPEKKSNCDRDDKKRPVVKKVDFNLVVASTNRIGPEPEIVQKQIGAFKGLAGDYAGYGCTTSPPPSAVPIPCFLRKTKLLA